MSVASRLIKGGRGGRKEGFSSSPLFLLFWPYDQENTVNKQQTTHVKNDRSEWDGLRVVVYRNTEVRFILSFLYDFLHTHSLLSPRIMLSNN
jgi:hypothetical protein